MRLDVFELVIEMVMDMIMGMLSEVMKIATKEGNGRIECQLRVEQHFEKKKKNVYSLLFLLLTFR